MIYLCALYAGSFMYKNVIDKVSENVAYGRAYGIDDYFE